MRPLLLGLAGFVPVAVWGAPVQFDIPSEPANRALLDFARQAHREVLFSYDDLKAVATPAVRGLYEPDAALALLLRGSPFAPQDNGQGGFVVVALPRPPRPPRVPPPPPPEMGRPGATPMDPYVVNAHGEGGTGSIDAASVVLGNVDLPRSENDAMPYLVYSRDQIARSGQTNLDDFLREEVLESDPTGASPDEGGLGSQAASQHQGFFNGSNLNLRAYDSDETLVLVNGLPLPTVLGGYQQGGATFERQADVNLVPLNLVERVEVLPVSAGALYSGNPVGGVINIVLRPNENIDELNVVYTNGTGVDAPDKYISLLHGRTLLGGRLSYRFAASFDQSVPPSEQELGDIARNLVEHPDLNYPNKVYPVPVYRATPNIYSVSMGPLFGPGSADNTSVAPGADGSGGLTAFTGRAGVPSLALYRAPGGMASSPNSADYAYGRKQFSQSYFGTATYDLFPAVQLGVQGLYTHKVTDPGFDIFQGNLTMKAANPLNPFGQDVYVNLAEAAPQLGQGYDEGRLDLYSGVAGILIKLPGAWRVSGDAQYSHTLTSFRGVAGVDSDRWQMLVDTGAYNPLRDTQAYGPPQAFYDQALEFFGRRGKFVNLDNYQTADGALRLTNTALPLPTGPAELTVGGDYNLQYQASFNDNQYYGDGEIAPTSGYWKGRTLQSFSGFAEGRASLLPPAWRPRWLQDLAFDAAARYNASDTEFGTNIAPAFGLKADFVGGFSVRASVTKTNRFPTATTARFIPLPGTPGTGAAGSVTPNLIIDPRLNDATYSVPSSDTPDVAARPEADVTQSAGVVYQTGRRNQLRVSLDWYGTRKSGELQYLDTQDVIDFESYLPGRIVRAPAAPGQAAGQILSVLTGSINLAYRQSSDWNLSCDYTRTEVAGGALHLYARYVYFQSYNRQIVPGGPVVDELNHPDTADYDLVRHRVNFGAGWSSDRVGFGVDGRYYSPRLLPQLLWAEQGSNHINSYDPFDAYVKANLDRLTGSGPHHPRITAELRVDNVLDRALPPFPTIPSGTGVEPYGDWRGRVYVLSLTTRF